MQKPPILHDEKLRLEELYSYQILDTAPDESFNELLEIAAQITACPTALISFVDKERQWFKSTINLHASELPRETSFCGHAIASDEAFTIEDTHEDSRFHDNPNVTGDFNIRFYAGIPIVSKNGFNLGTVCVIDHHARSISVEQQEGLQKIASQISKLVELRKEQLKNKALIESLQQESLTAEKNFEQLFRQSGFPKVIFTTGGYQIIDANDAALQLYGYNKEDFLQLNALNIRANKSKIFIERRMNKLKESSGPVILQSKHVTSDGKVIPVTLTVTKVVYKGELATLVDVDDKTEKKQFQAQLKAEKLLAEKKLIEKALQIKEKEKDGIRDVLQENINQILACTNLYLGIAKNNDAIRLEMIEKSQSNILLAIAEIKNLYRSIKSHGSKDQYLQELVENLILKYEMIKDIQIHWQSEGMEVGVADKIRVKLFKIIEYYLESLTKMSSIKNIWIQVRYTHQIDLIIKNDSQKNETSKPKDLQKINEDVISLGGSLVISGAEGMGFTMHCTIPLQ